jgi:hypothetical protein
MDDSGHLPAQEGLFGTQLLGFLPVRGGDFGMKLAYAREMPEKWYIQRAQTFWVCAQEAVFGADVLVSIIMVVCFMIVPAMIVCFVIVPVMVVSVMVVRFVIVRLMRVGRCFQHIGIDLCRRKAAVGGRGWDEEFFSLFQGGFHLFYGGAFLVVFRSMFKANEIVGGRLQRQNQRRAVDSSSQPRFAVHMRVGGAKGRGEKYGTGRQDYQSTKSHALLLVALKYR